MSGHVSPELIDGLCTLLRKGAPLPTACDIVQVRIDKVLKWIDDGTPDPASGNVRDGYYATIADRIRESMAKSQLEALQLVIDAARGWDETTTIENEKGTTTITRKKRDWRAAAWLLERLHPHQFGTGERVEPMDVPVKEIVLNAPQSAIDEMSRPLEVSVKRLSE